MATEPHWRLFCLAATMSTSALDKAESGVDENRMVEEYMEEHPDADWSDAYERTADKAYQRMIDDLSAAADLEHDRRKEERLIRRDDK